MNRAGDLPVWAPVWIWIAGILLAVPSGRMLNKMFVRAIGREGLRLLLLSAGVLIVGRALVALWSVLAQVGPRRAALGLLCVAAYAVCLAWNPLPEEMSHFFQYTPLALLLERALSRRLAPWPRTAATIAACAFVGVCDEGLQHMMPGRVFDPRDVWLDVAGGALPVLFLRAIGLELRPRD